MKATVFAGILLLIALGCWIAGFLTPKASKATDDDVPRGVLHAVAAGFLLLAALFFILPSIKEVSTKNVGIETAFGRPVGTLSNGIHWAWPWVSVTEMDAAIQTNVFTANPNQDNSQDYGCLDVRIAYQITACVDDTIRWRINDKSAEYLFQNYRDFNNVQNSLVAQDLKKALNVVLAKYDPYALDANGEEAGPTLAAYSVAVTKQLQSYDGHDIIVLSNFIPILNYSTDVQTNINNIQTQYAKTRVAQQAEQTASAQARANDLISASVHNDPGVLESQCLNGVNAAIAANYALPAGYNCLGGSTGVVIPASR